MACLPAKPANALTNTHSWADGLLSQRRILVASVTRNCERFIESDISNLYAALKSCRSLSWLVIESDSSDKTLDALQALSLKIPEFRFKSLGSLASSIPIRTARIAHCRNTYLDELESNPLYADVDYVVVADLDGVNNLITAEGFASCWIRDGWDVCTANQRGPYYDTWALRHPVWNPTDCWRQYDFLRSHGIQREVAAWASMYSRMITLPESADWVEVESAFGGLGVYRRNALSDIRYSGVDETGESICEHVWLNRQIRNKGCRIFINPRLINTAHTNQSHQRSTTQTLKRYFLDLRHQAKLRVLRPFSNRS